MATRGHHGLLLTGDTLWTPTSLSTALQYWYDPTSSVTVTSAPNLDQWNDLSTNGWHLTASGTGRPAYQASPFQVTFATGDFMGFPSGALSLYQAVTSGWMMAVFKRDTADGGNTERPVVAFGTSGTGTRIGLYAGGSQTGQGNHVQMGGRRLDGDPFDFLGSAATYSGDWIMAVGYIDYMARTIDLRVNGTAETTKTSAFAGTGTTSNTASSRARLSSNMTFSPSTNLGGHEALVMGGITVPSLSDIERLEGWAAWTFSDYGLVADLPVGHPYKSEPPYA